MDGSDVESDPRLLGDLAWLRELLRDEAGAPIQRPRDAVRWPDEADEGGPAVDRRRADRRGRAARTAVLAEAAARVRQQHVGPVPRERPGQVHRQGLRRYGGAV